MRMKYIFRVIIRLFYFTENFLAEQREALCSDETRRTPFRTAGEVN